MHNIVVVEAPKKGFAIAKVGGVQLVTRGLSQDVP